MDKVLEIDADLGIFDEEIEFESLDDEENIEAQIDEQLVVGESTSDYNKLKNKPSINGNVLMGNYDEIDPTVPDWAKTANKPTYTPEEIGALDVDNAMTYTDLYKIWQTYFRY